MCNNPASPPPSPEEHARLLAMLEEYDLRDKKYLRKIKQLENNLEYLNTKYENEVTLSRFTMREREKQSLYNAILLESSPNILVVFDAELRYIIGTGRLLVQQFAFSDVLELNGLGIEELFSNAGDTGWTKTLVRKCREALRSGKSASYTTALRPPGKNAEVFLEITASPAIDKKGAIQGCVLLMHDVTELALAKNAAESASKTKSDFLAQMSHEIRTPMNAICGMGNLLSTTELTRTQREYTSTIIKASDSLLQIINDILDFSKIDAGRLELTTTRYATADIVTHVTNMIAMKAYEKQLAFTIDVNPDLPTALVGDEMRIKQVLINLVNNAVKYTASGEVAFSVNYTPSGNSGFLFCSVRDTGMGIKAENFESIFSAFTQLDRVKNKSIQGTGLGLAISRELARAMGGDISVSSVYGAGSTFTLTIPQEVADAAPLAAVTDPESKLACVIGSARDTAGIATMLKRLRVPHDVRENPALAGNRAYTHYICTGDTLGAFLAEEGAADRGDALVAAVRRLDDAAREYSGAVHSIYEPVLIMDIARILNAGERSVEEKDQAAAFSDAFFAVRNAQVLIVDDNEINLLVAQELLRQYGIEADTATGGREALSMAMMRDYDLVFMDHMMPDMDGVETTEKMRGLSRHYANAPIVALTANALVGMQDFFLANGMSDYISKPIVITDISRVLRHWLPPEKIIDAAEPHP